MYTGTLIEDLIAAVERVRAQMGDVEIYKVRAKNAVGDNDTEVVPGGSHHADADLMASADGTAAALSSDLISPHDTVDDSVGLVAAENFPLANAHMWAVPSGAAGGFGQHDPLA
jgi:hypothetical protein